MVKQWSISIQSVVSQRSSNGHWHCDLTMPTISQFKSPSGTKTLAETFAVFRLILGFNMLAANVLFCSQTGYVVSRESVFQLRHRSNIRIRPPRKTINTKKTPSAPTYPLVTETRFRAGLSTTTKHIFQRGRFRARLSTV